MNLRKINEVLGYGLFFVGASKIILVILIFIKLGTNILALFNGGKIDLNYYTSIVTLISWIQIILFFGSIVMILINIKKERRVIKGYLYELGAIALELLIPNIMDFYTIFMESALYMKAGSIIVQESSDYMGNNAKTTKKMIQNTEWFFADEQKTEQKNANDKDQKRINKIEEELNEWKKLLDNKEIDEETYNYETQKLINKEKKIKAKNRPM